MMAADEMWEAISYAMGVSSVLIWLCAQLPQIVKNWRRHSVEGLSPGFLVAWVAGDASNLLGCFLTSQLGVQVLLATYYCVVDVVLIAQFLLYRPRTEVISGLTTSLEQADHCAADDNTNHVPRSSSRLQQLQTKMAAVVGLAQTTDAAPIPTATEPAAGLKASELTTESVSTSIGYAVAYFSTGMYLFSRLPQIYHNFQPKSTTGVSMMLFTAAFLGNLTYTLSIVLSPPAMGPERRAFLLNELSYILGAAGTMLFDCIILAQWYWYQRRSVRHRRRSTDTFDRIQRPYLGTPRPDSPKPVQATLPGAQPGAWVRIPSRKTSRGRRSTSWHETSPLLSSSQQARYLALQDENPIND